MNNLFTFVIPTHNSKNTIARLLESINNSPFKDFQSFDAVIVDDNSKDQTVTKIKSLVSKLKFPVRVFPIKKHVGPAKARNFGVKKAQGKYVIFLDGDVEFKKNTLQNIYKLLEKKRIKAFTGIWHWKQKTNALFPQFKALRDWCYWFVERQKGYRYYLFSTRIAGIEKKLFTELKGFDETYPEPTVEDIEFTYRIERRAPIKFCADIVVNHEFEGFLPVAIKYFKRSRDWIKLFVVRKQFDPVATSKSEGIKPFLVVFFCLFTLFYLLSGLDLFLYLALFTGILFIISEARFLKLLYQKKGLVFMLQSIPVSIVLYIVILFGATLGYSDVIKNRIAYLSKQK